MHLWKTREKFTNLIIYECQIQSNITHQTSNNTHRTFMGVSGLSLVCLWGVFGGVSGMSLGCLTDVFWSMWGFSKGCFWPLVLILSQQIKTLLKVVEIVFYPSPFPNLKE